MLATEWKPERFVRAEDTAGRLLSAAILLTSNDLDIAHPEALPPEAVAAYVLVASDLTRNPPAPTGSSDATAANVDPAEGGDTDAGDGQVEGDGTGTADGQEGD